MAILNFPNTKPNGDPLEDGDLYTGDNGIVYRYDGVKWLGRNSSSLAVTEVATTSTAPTLANGRLWFNTIDGRGYVRYNNNWLDFSPSLLDGLTIDGTTITPVDLNSTVSIGTAGNIWTIGTDGSLIFPNDVSISPIAFDGFDVNVTDKTWSFRADGALGFPAGYILPNTIGEPGQVIIMGGQGGTYWGDQTGSSGTADTGSWTFDTVTATTDGNIIVKAGTGTNAWASLLSNNGANSFWVDDVGAHVTSNFIEGETTENYWTFDTNGNLTFPQGTLLGYSDPGGFIIDGAVDKDIAIYTYSGADAHGWTFGTDGILTLPGGNTQISNQGMASTSSSVVLASVGATGGAALEWISDPELSTSTKIAFVIANNTLSANSGTVQIATGGITFNGPDEPPVLENVWDFGKDGTLTIPDDIQDANGSVVRVATTSTAPTRVNGQLWFNTIDGRGYIRYNDTWIDLNPTEVPAPSTYLDGLTINDTTISAVDTTATVSIESGANVWEFGTDGLLTLPAGLSRVTSYGQLTIETDNGRSGMYANATGVNLLYANSNVTLRANSTGTTKDWTFGADGNLTLPNNSTITSPTDFTITSAGDINIRSLSTNTVNIFAELHVHSSSAPLTEPILRILDNGAIRMLVPAVDNLSAAVMIIGSTTTNYVAPQNTGVMEHLTGQAGTPTRIYSDGINAYAAYVGRRYDGTATSPQAVTTTSGNAGLISRIGATPYVGAVTNGGWPQLTTSRIEFRATEDQTPANQGNQIEFWTTPIGTSTIHQDISISSRGIGFRDGSYQDTAAIPLTQKGVAYGVATLGSDAKVTPAQLPAGAIIYKGAWNAATNTPFLYASSGTYTIGWEYSVSSTGTQSIDGGGPIDFFPGDYILYNGTGWDRIPGNNGSVITFNNRTGDVVMTTTDVTNVLTPGSIAASKIDTPYITINPGVGLSGGGQVNLGSIVNINNVGVTSIINGGGLTVSNNTGSVTLTNAGVTSITAGTGTHVSTSTDGVVVWVDLLSGPTGYTGSTGTQGVIGYTGSTGTQGVIGYTGSTGTQGVIGYTGSTGTQGVIGYTGSTGTQGVIGYTGSTGTQGVIGYTGSKGVADVYVSSISTGTGIFVTTSTGAVTVSLNTATTMKEAVSLVSMNTILAGAVTIDPPSFGKNTAIIVTATITGLTTNHHIVMMPSTATIVGFYLGAAYCTGTNVVSLQFHNVSGGNIDMLPFNLSYLAWV